MSFNLNVTITPDLDPATAVMAKWTEPSGPLMHQAENGTATEANQLMAAAIDAVRNVTSGLGDNWTSATVAISGHANPGHGPREGWANEFLQINVAVQSYGSTR